MRFIHIWNEQKYIHLSQHLGITWKNTSEILSQKEQCSIWYMKYHLVGGIPTLWKIWVSWDYDIPNRWKVIKHVPVTNQMKYCGWLHPSGIQTWLQYGKSPFLMDKSTISMATFNSFLYVYRRVTPLKIPWDFPSVAVPIRRSSRNFAGSFPLSWPKPRASERRRGPKCRGRNQKGPWKPNKKWRDRTSLWLSCVKSMKSSNECIQTYSKLGFKSDFFGGKAQIDEWFIAIPFDIAIKRCSPFQKPTPIWNPNVQPNSRFFLKEI